MFKNIIFLIIPFIFIFFVNFIFVPKKIENNLLSQIDIQNNFDNKLNKQLKNKFISKNIDNKKQLISVSKNTNNPNWKHSFSKKKSTFINTLLPLINDENQKIISKRNKLIVLKNSLIKEKTLSSKHIDYLVNLSSQYKVSTKLKHKVDIINELLIKIDVIPNSIVLAQAANESGWGTSRFAKEHNALFGQYTYDANNGVIPYKRQEGETFLIKNFTSINQSVESYFRNINTHYAYKDFRYIRSNFSNNNLEYNIKKLTKTLSVYAQDKLYVDTINSIIDSNNLIQFDLKFYNFTNS